MGKVITFAQQKGGAGKTTTLVHLAHSWAHHGRAVGLVDLDPQRSLTSWANLHRETNLNAISSKDWKAGVDIRDSAKKHDVTLVDCPGNADILLRSAIRESDLVLIPCQPTGLDVWATNAVLDLCRKEGKPARVILNRVPARGGTVEEALEMLREHGAEIMESRLGNRVAFSSGFLSGNSAVTGAKKSTARDEIENLRHEIDGLLETL